MSESPLAVIEDAINRLQNLVALARQPDDDEFVLLGEEIEGMSGDEAQELLMAAILIIDAQTKS